MLTLKISNFRNTTRDVNIPSVDSSDFSFAGAKKLIAARTGIAIEKQAFMACAQSIVGESSFIKQCEKNPTVFFLYSSSEITLDVTRILWLITQTDQNSQEFIFKLDNPRITGTYSDPREAIEAWRADEQNLTISCVMQEDETNVTPVFNIYQNESRASIYHTFWISEYELLVIRNHIMTNGSCDTLLSAIANCKIYKQGLILRNNTNSLGIRYGATSDFHKLNSELQWVFSLFTQPYRQLLGANLRLETELTPSSYWILLGSAVRAWLLCLASGIPVTTEDANAYFFPIGICPLSLTQVSKEFAVQIKGDGVKNTGVIYDSRCLNLWLSTHENIEPFTGSKISNLQIVSAASQIPVDSLNCDDDPEIAQKISLLNQITALRQNAIINKMKLPEQIKVILATTKNYFCWTYRNDNFLLHKPEYLQERKTAHGIFTSDIQAGTSLHEFAALLDQEMVMYIKAGNGTIISCPANIPLPLLQQILERISGIAPSPVTADVIQPAPQPVLSSAPVGRQVPVYSQQSPAANPSSFHYNAGTKPDSGVKQNKSPTQKQGCVVV